MKIRSLVLTVVVSVCLLGVQRQALAWQAGGFRLTPIVATGDEVASPVPFANFGPAAINDAGHVAFIARDLSGLYIQSNGTITSIAQTSEPVPGLANTYFDELRALSLNNQGQVAFIAAVVGERNAVGIFLFSLSSQSIQPVVLSGDRVPGPVFASFQDFLNVSLNESGHVAFTGSLRPTESGAFLFSNGAIQPIAVPGQTAPGGGQFTTVSARTLANNGTLLIQAGLRNSSGSAGLFLYRSNALQSVVLIGQAAPGGGAFQRFGFSTLIAENGDVAFSGFAIGGNSATGGVFVVSNGRIDLVLAGGQPVPAAGGKRINEFSSLSSNLRGDLAFRATFEGQEQAVFLYSQGRVNLVVFSDRNVSGSFARRYFPLGDVSVNGSATMAFVGQTMTPTTSGVFVVSGSQITPAVTSQTAAPTRRSVRLSRDVAISNDGGVAFTTVATGNGTGLYLAQNGMIVPQAVPGQGAPDSGNALISELVDPVASRYAMTDQHAIAFVASLTGGTAPEGVFRVSGGALESVAVVGQTAQGITFLDVDQVVVNNAGAVAFNGYIRQGNEKEALVLFSTNRRHQVIAAAEQTVSGTGGAAFSVFQSKDVWINDAGDVAFIAGLDDGREGVFLYSSNRISLVALGEAAAPGTNGKTFGTFGSVMVNNQKQVVFDSEFASGGGGVFRFANDQLTPVAFAGQAVPGVSGRTFTVFGRTAISDSGQVAFFARWAGLGRGIFFSSASALAPIAVNGQLLPDQGQMRFFDFYGLSLNNRNEIVFTASIDSSPLPSAIFLATPVSN